MNKRNLGRQKEMIAAEFLKKKGCQILEENYRCKTGEIDLIALDGRYIVFAEVKYRKETRYGFPEEAVTWQKQRKISKVALWYLTKKGWSTYTPCRFDVIAIDEDQIRWYQDAFSFQC